MERELFVENVKALCMRKGLKPTVACKDCGVGGSFLSDINRGQTPSVEKVQILASYLGVTTSELLGEIMPAARISVQLPAEEVQLLEVFRSLDQTGRIKVQSYAEGLVDGAVKTGTYEGGEPRLA